MPASRLVAAAGVLAVGLCAAWPFRQPERAPRRAEPERSLAPLELTLRRPEEPLAAAARSDVSPAVGLASATNLDDKPVIATPALINRVEDLANLLPPPALPVSFQPPSANRAASDWRPSGTPPRSFRSLAPDERPRRYRLRDGDTLESIAERFLGNRARGTEIFAANRDVLARPDLLPLGTTITIPPKYLAGELVPVAGNK